MTIQVVKIVGPNCISYEDGDKIYSIIHASLKKGEKTQLDFSGVEIFASLFFNAAVGHLLQDIPRDQLRDNLELLGLSDEALVVLKRVIDNSGKYYLDQRNKKAVDDAFSNPSE